MIKIYDIVFINTNYKIIYKFIYFLVDSKYNNVIIIPAMNINGIIIIGEIIAPVGVAVFPLKPDIINGNIKTAIAIATAIIIKPGELETLNSAFIFFIKIKKYLLFIKLLLREQHIQYDYNYSSNEY